MPPRQAPSNATLAFVGGITPRALRPDQSPAARYLLKLGSAHSRRTMRTALARVAAIGSGGRLDAAAFPWHQLRYQHTQLIRARLMAEYTPSGANLRLAALRGVLKEAFRLGLMLAEDFHRAADLPSIRNVRLPRGRSLAAGEIGALFAACEADPTPAGARDAAILALLYAAGLRRSEAVALDRADWDVEAGELRIVGKGRRERLAYLHGGAAEALKSWLEVRGEASGPLLCPIDRGGRIEFRRLSAQAVLLACRKRAEEAGVKRFSPHDLRRTFIGDLLDAGVDLSTVQQMAGHAHVTTTVRYDRRPEDRKRRAAQRLHVPYAKRCRRDPHNRP